MQEGFLDGPARAALLRSAESDSVSAGAYTKLPVAASLSERLIGALGRFAPDLARAVGAAAAGAPTMLLPFSEFDGHQDDHQDRYREGPQRGQLAEGQVGVVYLEGQGDFVFTDVATGDEHRVAIEPGKLISWPNAHFRHRVEDFVGARRLLGPMLLDAVTSTVMGVGGPQQCDELDGYLCVDDGFTPPASQANGDDCSNACASAITAYYYSQFQGK